MNLKDEQINIDYPRINADSDSCQVDLHSYNFWGGRKKYIKVLCKEDFWFNHNITGQRYRLLFKEGIIYAQEPFSELFKDKEIRIHGEGGCMVWLSEANYQKHFKIVSPKQL